MRLSILLLPVLALSACATPQEQCLGKVTRDARINASLITQTRANLERGFGLRTEDRVREVRSFCRGETESGESVVTRCEKVRVTKVQVPVALDLAAERAKLASLISQRDRLAVATADGVAQCRALYPESA